MEHNIRRRGRAKLHSHDWTRMIKSHFVYHLELSTNMEESPLTFDKYKMAPWEKMGKIFCIFLCSVGIVSLSIATHKSNTHTHRLSQSLALCFNQHE
jgi:hypothetical protein